MVAFVCGNELDEAEQHFVKVFDSFKSGFNLTPGGDCVAQTSHAAKEKKLNALQAKRDQARRAPGSQYAASCRDV